MTWLTPKRLRGITIALTVLALAIPSIGLGSSTKPPPHHPAHPAATLR
jgi:hypothetical protein